MGRSVMLSNGRMLVGLNNHGLVHDFYYPYVGLDNLTTSRSAHHSIGVWVNDRFSWLDDGTWDIKIDFDDDALISSILAKNETLSVELHFRDFVDERYDAFCRKITIKNTRSLKSEIRVFMHQVFQISRGGRGDTAMFVPEQNYLLDYKGQCTLLVYAEDEVGRPFDQFAVGNFGIEGKEGTFKDAEDGELSGNLVEHGGVDSVLRCRLEVEPGDQTDLHYWVIASDSQFNAEIIHLLIKKKGFDKRLERTINSWRQWMAIGSDKIDKFDPKYQKLAKKSLLVIKSHIDRRGGIIASCDSSIYNYGRDYYSYVWPRDGALTILPLIQLGYTEEPKRFFEFCADTIHPAGYMMHKYQPDRAIGSTWHPLLHHNHPELAIQEDETAAVIYSLGEYFDKTGDIDFIRNLYSHLVRPSCNFMARFVDKATALPHASYDLWEEKFATHTYSVILTIAALKNGAMMANQIGEAKDAARWLQVASEINKGLPLLFNQELGYYRKSLLLKRGGDLEFDDTLDSSTAYAFLAFEDENLTSEEVKRTYEAIEKHLLDSSPSGGVPRYQHDNYFLTKNKYLGNPWIICTLWLARYYLKANRTEDAFKLIDWVCDRTSASGMLPEQVDPEDGNHVGVSPLIWSHSTLIETLLVLQ